MSSLASGALGDDLRSYYELDETSGPVVDAITSTANDGINSGASRGVSGIINNAFDFEDSESDLVTLPNSFGTFDNHEFTINFWFNAETIGGDAAPISFQGERDINLAFNTPTTFRWEINGAGGLVIPSLNTGTWYMVTIRANSTGRSIWVNGTLNQTNSITTVANPLSETNFLGNGTGGFYDGLLDEIGIWNRSLNDAEISDLYNSGNGLVPLTLSVNLLTPSVTATADPLLFNASIQPLQTDLINATLYLWNSTGNLINQTTNEVIGSTLNYSAWNILNHPVGSFLWNVLAVGNDSSGLVENWATTNNSYDYGYAFNSEFHQEPIPEGSNSEFTLNLTLAQNLLSSVGVLIYNGTSYTATRTEINNESIFTVSPTAPALNSNSNISFRWELTLNDGTRSVVFNITNSTQEVFNMQIDTCDSFTNEILNFTVVDEEFQTDLINASIEAAINIYSTDRSTLVFNVSNFTSGNQLSICLSDDIVNGSGYSLDSVIQYTGDDHAIEYYNIINYSLNSTALIQNIDLFSLNLSDSTEFQFSFLGEDFLPVGGALVFLERQYIAENLFKVVELPLTDSTGKTILHMVRNDIVYNIRVVKDGVLLGSFENIVAFCQDFTIGNCQISLTATSSSLDDFNYNAQIGVVYSNPSYNSATNVVSFDFTSLDGTVKNIFFNVTRNDVFGNRTICSDSAVAASGTLGCSLDPSITETLLIVSIAIDDQVFSITHIDIDESDYGPIGYIAWFIITLVLIFGMGESKNGVLIAMLLSYIGAIFLGISNGTVIGRSSAGVWIITITLLGIWRINREKPQ